ncbi:sodium:proton antiporter [Salinibacterium sp. NSLL150]|uniref:monovalent cation/H+ antiporter complex subunit F n=1 Tax=unclassified Salinibacterium TaxID=2632331 RepID=UPI0018CD09F0|nr:MULTISPECIES: monovalent cation/H+ antiporter complex subunit F [unclassified Salinibacterium]MBH0023360.1 sodium:proton antiporter [Salinibacterium sp. SWN248]MBH0098339.1 sodium:proton antiporter [Salinibacterium sp. NSLL35]MBH0101094.1 sodium:proton antiporter [Salinibacterium sp. NSLL150]MBH0103853.1 sodium:proton antiporter [Salinibacterium sp. NSLL16]MBH0106614.1 sodium:proton antiporter [Salinibacterium sp. NSLL17]
MSEWVFIAVGVMLLVAGLLALYRIIRGPSILDRMIASDMLLTTIICALGAEMVYNGHTRSLPAMLVLASTAFLGSVVVARYVSRRTNS